MDVVMDETSKVNPKLVESASEIVYGLCSPQREVPDTDTQLSIFQLAILILNFMARRMRRSIYCHRQTKVKGLLPHSSKQ